MAGKLRCTPCDVPPNEDRIGEVKGEGKDNKHGIIDPRLELERANDVA